MLKLLKLLVIRGLREKPSGVPILLQEIKLRMSIVRGLDSQEIIYSEMHDVRTQ